MQGLDPARQEGADQFLLLRRRESAGTEHQVDLALDQRVGQALDGLGDQRVREQRHDRRDDPAAARGEAARQQVGRVAGGADDGLDAGAGGGRHLFGVAQDAHDGHRRNAREGGDIAQSWPATIPGFRHSVVPSGPGRHPLVRDFTLAPVNVSANIIETGRQALNTGVPPRMRAAAEETS